MSSAGTEIEQRSTQNEMNKGILIAFSFGLMGAAVVMIYATTTWQQPMTPFLYALLGVVPLSFAGAVAIILDDIDRAAWWKDGQVWGCLIAALIASLAIPSAWAAPNVRGNMLSQFASDELAMSALALDRDEGIRLKACMMLIDHKSQKVAKELTSRLANSPNVGLACIDATRDKKQTKEIARRVALRWHAGLVGLDDLSKDYAKTLVEGIKQLPLLPQQQVTTLYDCAIHGANKTNKQLCVDALSGKPKRACAGLSGLLSPRRLNEWESLGVTLGASWGEPEATKTNQSLVAATELTCPEVKDFSLEATCNAIVEDVMSRDDRRYFEWVLSNNTECLKPEHISEWISARDVCELILEAKDEGKRLDEIIVCNSRRVVADKEITRRKMALAEAARVKEGRNDLAAQIVEGSNRAAGGSPVEIANSMLGRDGDCFTDRQVGAMMGQMFGKSPDGFNAIDLMTGDVVAKNRAMIDGALEANAEMRNNSKFRNKLAQDKEIDQDEANEALSQFEEDEETGKNAIKEQLDEQFEEADKMAQAASTSPEERDYMRCLQEGRSDCIPAQQKTSGYTENRPCMSAFPNTPGGLEEHMRNMQQVRPW